MSRAVMLLVFLAVGCQRQEDSELLLLCGGSFRTPVERLAAAFERDHGARVALSFGQSEDLLPQVLLKSAGDLFVTHDPYEDRVRQADNLLDSVVVGHVAPVLVVAPGNPEKVQSIADLSRPKLRVCLPNPQFSTCGEMLSHLLKRKGIEEAVTRNVGNAMFRSHSQIGSAIELKHCDAGVMWNGVASTWKKSVEIVPTPYEYDQEIRVTVLGLKHSKHESKVRQFLEFARAHGEVFSAAGYIK